MIRKYFQDWRENLVAENLKYFLRSFSSDKNLGRPSNLVVRFDNSGRGERLDFVARIDTGGRMFGWKSCGHVGDHFHDGFLFGPADQDGDISGWYKFGGGCCTMVEHTPSNQVVALSNPASYRIFSSFL